MHNKLKTIINPSPFMKNTGDDSRNCKINAKSIRTACTRQQGKPNFKVYTLRSSVALVTGEGNLFGGNFSNCYFPSSLFLIATNGCMRERDRQYPVCRALKKTPALFQNDGHLRGLRPSRSHQQRQSLQQSTWPLLQHTLPFSFPAHCDFVHNSSKAKTGPVEKELIPWLWSSLGVTRSDDHCQDAAQLLRTLSEVTPLKRILSGL